MIINQILRFTLYGCILCIYVIIFATVFFCEVILCAKLGQLHLQRTRYSVNATCIQKTLLIFVIPHCIYSSTVCFINYSSSWLKSLLFHYLSKDEDCSFNPIPESIRRTTCVFKYTPLSNYFYYNSMEPPSPIFC
jgi:hypothetical protein